MSINEGIFGFSHHRYMNPMKKHIKINILFALFFLLMIGCKTQKTEEEEKRYFQTSFESANDFDGFYISPQEYMGTSYHELSDSIVRSGSYAHMAWVTGTNPPSTPTENNNHRAYPSIQLHQLQEGSFQTPCYITFWVWLDMQLKEQATGENDWFSFATFSSDASDNWSRTILVNLNTSGFTHLMHVPNQGEQNHVFQTTELKFPQKEWVELKVYLDFRENGYAKVWQNGTLVSYAKVSCPTSVLAQAHFGLYCAPQIETGIVFNDDLLIKEVDGE